MELQEGFFESVLCIDLVLHLEFIHYSEDRGLISNDSYFKEKRCQAALQM